LTADIDSIERVFDAGVMSAAVSPHNLSLPALATRIDDPTERRARVRQLSASLAPVSLASQQKLPVVAALAELLPGGGVARGSTVSVGGPCGAVSLAALLAVEASKAGSWVVAVGMDEFNWEMALALGVVAERSVVVRVGDRSPATGVMVTEVMAAVVDAADVVLVGPEVGLSPTAVRRLRARARERGSVLVRVQPGFARPGAGRARRPNASLDDRWADAELSLQARALRWGGLGQGWGHLDGRLIEVAVGGRRRASAGGRGVLWLPDDQGRVRRVEAGEFDADRPGRSAEVVPLRPTGTGGM
jgi:hypothetical protein